MTVFCVQCGASNELAGAEGSCTQCGKVIRATGGTNVPPTSTSASASAGSGEVRTSKMAVASLVFGILMCLPVAVGFGIAALISISNSNGKLSGKGMAIAGIVVPVGMVPIIGILAAIAIPNFMKYQNRSKMTEARANLRALGTAEMSYYQEHDQFLPVGPTPATLTGERTLAMPNEVPSELGWSLDSPVRFQYQAKVIGQGTDQKVHLTADAQFKGVDGRPAHAEMDVFTDHLGPYNDGPAMNPDEP